MPQDSGPEPVVFDQFAGLRNTVARSRLGPTDLATARNIDLDNAGQPRRRRGYQRKAAGDFHSLTTVGGRTFVVRDGDLVRVFPDYSMPVLRGGVGPGRVKFVDVAGVTFFASNVTSGKIMPDDTVQDWGAVTAAGEWHSPVVNPTSTLPDINGKLLGPPPMAEHLALYNGRIYLAQDNVVWFTELYLFDYVDRTRNFLQFESKITGLIAVADGIYVGTATDVWFLQGSRGEMQRTRMTPAGMVEHTAIAVPAESLSLQEPTTGEVAMFVSSSGICVGLASGVCFSLTRDKVELPQAIGGAALHRREAGADHYIGALDSAGSPSSAARIGDYVHAEIKRFAGA
jgi:hypothetical protein